jgi:hypothetical protein
MIIDLERPTRNIIRLWDSMQRQEAELARLADRPGADARARLFALRRQLRHALAERDGLIAHARLCEGIGAGR